MVLEIPSLSMVFNKTSIKYADFPFKSILKFNKYNKNSIAKL